jgi:hypothetical protein
MEVCNADAYCGVLVDFVFHSVEAVLFDDDDGDDEDFHSCYY